jgi:hypothetical protein
MQYVKKAIKYYVITFVICFIAEIAYISATNMIPTDDNMHKMELYAFVIPTIASAVLLLLYRQDNIVAEYNDSFDGNVDNATRARIEERFPPTLLYRVPKEAITYFASKQIKSPLVEEVGIEWWKTLLEDFPKPPANDKERQEREVQFWTYYVNGFTKNDPDGTAQLAPKGDIINHFVWNEKQIFRHYYAATGILIRTIAENIIKATMDAKEALEMNKEFRKKYGSDDRISHTVTRAIDEQSRASDELPAHVEKWGNWFFHNIEETFKRQFEKETDFGPESATSPLNHPAQDDLSYKPNA